MIKRITILTDWLTVILTKILPDRLLTIFPPERLVRFCIVGGLGGALGLGIVYVLTDIAGLFYLVSSVIGWIIVSYLVYLGNCGWTFGKFVGIKGFGKFLTSRAATTAVGFSLGATLVSGFHVWYIAAFVIVAAVMAIANFLIATQWIWRGKKKIIKNAKKT